MILTEQNKNSGSFGETRTFSVAKHSADTMKKHINTANEQSLTQKNQTVSQAAENNVRAANAHPARTQSAHVRPNQAINQARSAAAQNNTVSQKTAQSRNSVQSQSRLPQSRLPQSQMPQSQMSQSRVSQSRVQQNIVSDIPNAQSVKSAVPQRSVSQRPVQKPAASKAASATSTHSQELHPQMMKTKSTDITAVERERLINENDHKKEKTQRVHSDEGGNTVVSVLKAVVYIIFIIVISVFLAIVIINVGNDIFSFVKSDEIVEVTIPEYATLDEVADILYKNDIIKYPTIFKLFAVAENADTDFLAGTYQVNGMMNYETLLEEFNEKPESGTVDITIPEGYTIDEMIDLFVDGYGIGTREGFVDVIQNGEFDYWFVEELEQNGIDDGRIYRLEGYLFPDTYQFYKASSEYTVVDKMLKRFTQIFTKEYRAQCEALNYTVDEIITLASIIEKEAGSPSDFFIVSSVFHNRLNNPWSFPKLESDATVVYVLSHEKGERTNVTSGDLSKDTPYNTYLYDGFPPGPIANPSASAMLAALSPTKTNFYFFYTNKGVLYPSATKAEHDAIIAQFRDESASQQTTGDR